jgi:hypothetical protein
MLAKLASVPPVARILITIACCVGFVVGAFSTHVDGGNWWKWVPLFLFVLVLLRWISQAEEDFANT